jgi:hypothetical protein
MVVYLKMMPVAHLALGQLLNKWLGDYVEGKDSGLIWVTKLEFVWRCWVELWKPHSE